MSADRLRAIREAATPGPWRHVAAVVEGTHSRHIRYEPADARLIALAPDLAEWVADAADALTKAPFPSGQDADYTYWWHNSRPALLERLAVLVPDQDGRL